MLLYFCTVTLFSFLDFVLSFVSVPIFHEHFVKSMCDFCSFEPIPWFYTSFMTFWLIFNNIALDSESLLALTDQLTGDTVFHSDQNLLKYMYCTTVWTIKKITIPKKREYKPEREWNITKAHQRKSNTTIQISIETTRNVTATKITTETITTEHSHYQHQNYNQRLQKWIRRTTANNNNKIHQYEQPKSEFTTATAKETCKNKEHKKSAVTVKHKRSQQR